jgi:hypothetical protein
MRKFFLALFALIGFAGAAPAQIQTPAAVNGCIYLANPITLTDKQRSAFLCDANGKLLTSGGGGSSGVNPAPGFYTYPAQGDLYARFTQSTQSYYSPLPGGATTSFATWLTNVSGTFTRSGTVAPYWTSGGLLANGSANTPRFSYDPVTLVPNLLYEPASANLATFTQDSSNAVWAFSNAGIGTRTANAATGLDGGTTAGIFREATPSTQHLVWWLDNNAAVTSGNFYAFQIYLQGVNRTRMRIQPSGSGMGSTAFIVDLANVTVSDPSWAIEKLVNGYVRLYKVFQATASAAIDIRFYLLDALGGDTYAGSTSAGWNLGGVQMEQVASLSSPPSTYMARLNATAVSRSADALAFTLPAGASSLTYTYANGQTQVASVSPGAYSVPTNLNNYQIASFVDVDLTQVAAPVLSVAGRTGNVALQQSDVAGLKTTDIGFFSGLSLSSVPIRMGTSTSFPSMLRSEGQVFSWVGTAAPTKNVINLPGASRYIIIGGGGIGQTLLPSSQSNAVLIGNDAAAFSTTIAAATIVGDTALGSTTSAQNVSAFGNEAGNTSGTVSASNFFGNLAGKHVGGGVYTRVDAMGVNAMRYVAGTDAVVIGSGAVYDTTASGRTLTQSVVLGSTAGNTIAGAGTSTGLILIGYGAQPVTPTTSNYLNIGGALKGDMSGGTYAFTTSAGGDAVTTSALLKTKPYTVSTLPAAPGAGARGFVTDATACVLNAALTGGGAVGCPVHYDGAAWVGG